MDTVAGELLPSNSVTEIDELRACQACYREPSPAAEPRFATIQRRTEALMPLLRSISMPRCITLMTWPCPAMTRAESTNSMDEPASGRFYATFFRFPGLRRLQPSLFCSYQGWSARIKDGPRAGFTEQSLMESVLWHHNR